MIFSAIRFFVILFEKDLIYLLKLINENLKKKNFLDSF